MGNLDKTKTSKPTEVVIVKPVDVKGIIMTDKKQEPPKQVSPPPSPPPPPPTRLIKEGVEIVKPQQEKKDGKCKDTTASPTSHAHGQGKR